MTGEKYPFGIIPYCCFFSVIIFVLLEPHCCTGNQALLDGPDEKNDDDHYASQLKLNRNSFPPEFTFGVGSSAYQYEGAADQGGRRPSIWDTFTKLYPDKIKDHSSGMIADEFYYLYKEDISSLKEIGWDLFRFSISWPRLVPYGKVSKGVNQQGINFYNSLIDELLAHGIQPFVTLFHWDLPQALEDEYGGFLSRKIVDDFRDYANLCFKEFGNRVKYWATLNEPNNFAKLGYALGTCAPGRCSYYMGNCTAGNSATEPYVVVHNQLLSHASAVQLYKSKYQISQKGKIGLTTSSFWMKPKFPTDSSKKASLRAFDFQFGWIVDPITFGDYPKSMRFLVGRRLPNFTTAESEMLRGSYDYLGVNYYTARYVDESWSYSTTYLSYTTDCRCNLTTERDGIPIGEPTAVDWLYVYPKGIRKLMHYVKNKYNPSLIYISENGVANANNSTLPLEDALRDTLRIKYHKLHLFYLLKAIKEGVNVKGYLAWSFLDDFEWNFGYTIRFGLTFIDYKNGLKRYLKDSSLWFKKFLRREDTTHPHGVPLLHVSQ